jgi:hypothetical protein
MKTEKNKILLFSLLISITLLTSCSGNSNYDKGYEDAINGKEKGLLYSISKEYKSGYNNGFAFAEVEDCWEFHNHDLEKTAYELGIPVKRLKEKLAKYELW